MANAAKTESLRVIVLRDDRSAGTLRASNTHTMKCHAIGELVRAKRSIPPVDTGRSPSTLIGNFNSAMSETLPVWTPGGGLHYKRLTTSGRARRGRFVTAHGVVETPSFMPVGTQATVKCVLPDQVASDRRSGVLANTYHLAFSIARRSSNDSAAFTP